MRNFRFFTMLAIVFSGWNCGNKKTVPEKIPKALPHYKLAYVGGFENFSFHFTFDTTQNIIEAVTDSIDVLMRDFDIYCKFYDSTYQMNYEGNTFSHYYINKYCLDKDTFELCKQTIADTFPLPLIFELGKSYSRAYISPKSFETFPTDGIGDSTEKISEHHFNTIQLAEISFLMKDSVSMIFDDEFIDLNYDSIPERLVAYRAKDGNSCYVILEKQNQKWVVIQKIILYWAEYINIYSLQMSGKKNRSVLLKVYYAGYVPRKRYFENVYLYLPAE